jgi:hypothetical protein
LLKPVLRASEASYSTILGDGNHVAHRRMFLEKIFRDAKRRRLVLLGVNHEITVERVRGAWRLGQHGAGLSGDKGQIALARRSQHARRPLGKLN